MTDDRYGPEEAPVRKAGVRRLLFGDLGSGAAILTSLLFAALMVVGATLAFTVPRSDPSQPYQIVVPMRRAGGVFVVPVEVSGAVTIDFVVDGGAAVVSVPRDVFWALKRAGTIKDADMLESRTYVMADGSRSRQTRFTIRHLEVGGVVFRNVPATVTQSGWPLLGQSFLYRFRSVSIDNASHTLRLEY